MKALNIKGFNFYKAYNKKPKLTASDINKRRTAAISALVVIAIVGVAAYFYIDILKIKNDIKAEREYLDDPSVISAFNQASADSDRAAGLAVYSSSLEYAKSGMDSSPETGKALFKTIEDEAGYGITIEQYDYSFMTGILLVDITATSVDDAADFVTRLKGTGAFAGVTYAGYRSSDGIAYGFTVECELPAGTASEGGAE